tara:strand:- start:276 stop:560 length:285 start_codon:yes stop_codon:yes gene_type:complete
MRDTSIIAFKELKESGEINRMEGVVLQALADLNGAATNAQLSLHLDIPINQVTGRTNSLEKKNIIEAHRQVRNPVTNKLNWEWKIKINLQLSIN